MKKVCTVIIIVSICSDLLANNITANGIGTTKEEAKASAVMNLSSCINGAFVSSSVFYGVHEDENGYQEASSSNSSLVTSGYLKSVEYAYEESDDGYTCTATIVDNDINRRLFVIELNSLNSTISTLNASLSKQIDKVKKNTLVSLYGALSEFESYRNVLIHLGHSELVPDLSANVSSTSVYTEYENIVIAEGYALEERERFITDETEHQKLLEELSANRMEQRRLEREKNETIKAKEEAAKLALAVKLSQSYTMVMDLSESFPTTSKDLYKTLKKNIEKTRANFLKACEEYDEICREQFALVDKDYEAEKKAVESRPYRFAELQGNKPTAAAKANRDQELDYLYMSKEMHKVAIFKQIRLSLLDLIQIRYENYVDSFSAIDGQNFAFLLSSSSLKNNKVAFDAINTSWTITTTIGNGIAGLENKSFNFVLSYDDLTGKAPMDAKFRGQDGYDEYMEYLDEVDYLESLMREFSKNFRLTVRFKASVKKSETGIGYDGIDLVDIAFEIESNAITGNEDYAIIKGSTPSSVMGSKEYSWTLPGYAKTFDKEFKQGNAK